MTAKPLARRVAVVAAIGAAAAGMTPVAMATTGQAGRQALPITRGPYAQAPDSDSGNNTDGPEWTLPTNRTLTPIPEEDEDSETSTIAADSGSEGDSSPATRLGTTLLALSPSDSEGPSSQAASDSSGAATLRDWWDDSGSDSSSQGRSSQAASDSSRPTTPTDWWDDSGSDSSRPTTPTDWWDDSGSDSSRPTTPTDWWDDSASDSSSQGRSSLTAQEDIASGLSSNDWESDWESDGPQAVTNHRDSRDSDYGFQSGEPESPRHASAPPELEASPRNESFHGNSPYPTDSDSRSEGRIQPEDNWADGDGTALEDAVTNSESWVNNNDGSWPWDNRPSGGESN
jgi:hypothetical protein